MAFSRNVGGRRSLVCFASIVAIFLSGPSGADSLPKLEQIARRARTLEEFLTKKDLQEEYRKALKSYLHRDHYRCESFDAILKKLVALVEKEPRLAARIWRPRSYPAFEIATFPSVNDPLADIHVKNQIRFVPVPRVFHALWNDPSNEGCLTDDCTKDKGRSPDRWASLLEGSRVYWVEKNGIFVDASVLIVPMTDGKRKYTYLSQTGKGFLNRSLAVPDNKTGLKRFTNLLSEWRGFVEQGKDWGTWISTENEVPKVSQKLLRPRGKSKAIADAPVSQDLMPLDRTATIIEKALPRGCLAAHLDGKVPSVQEGASLVLGNSLNEKPAIAGGPVFALTTPTEEVKKINSEPSPMSTPGTTALVASESDRKERLISALTNVMLNDPNEANRLQAGKTLQSLLGNRGRRPASEKSTLSRGERGSNYDLASQAMAHTVHDPSKAVQALAKQSAVGGNGGIAAPSSAPLLAKGPLNGEAGIPSFPSGGVNGPGGGKPGFPSSGGGGGGGEEPGEGSSAEWRAMRQARQEFQQAKTPEEKLAKAKQITTQFGESQNPEALQSNLKRLSEMAMKSSADRDALSKEFDRLNASGKCDKNSQSRWETFETYLAWLSTNLIPAAHAENHDSPSAVSSGLERGDRAQVLDGADTLDKWTCDPKTGEKTALSCVEPNRIYHLWTSLKPVGSGGLETNLPSPSDGGTTWYPSKPSDKGSCVPMLTDRQGRLIQGKLMSSSVVTGTELGKPDEENKVYFYFSWYKNGEPPGTVRMPCLDGRTDILAYFLKTTDNADYLIKITNEESLASAKPVNPQKSGICVECLQSQDRAARNARAMFPPAPSEDGRGASDLCSADGGSETEVQTQSQGQPSTPFATENTDTPESVPSAPARSKPEALPPTRNQPFTYNLQLGTRQTAVCFPDRGGCGELIRAGNEISDQLNELMVRTVEE